MDEADDRLRALFAQDQPPARDPHFETAVMEAVMRRELAGAAPRHGGAFPRTRPGGSSAAARAALEPES